MSCNPSVRASYREAVEWIAANDNSGNGDTVEETSEYVSTALVADLWRKDSLDVARDIARKRGDVPGFEHRRHTVQS